MAELTPFQLSAVNEISARLGISNPEWLMRLIEFESNWDPFAKNPRSSARGLIQFIDSTAIGMGYNSSYDLVQKNPTIESQLKGPVYQYLNKYKPFRDEYQLYMAVFFPAARNYPPDTTFKKIYSDLGISNKYTSFASANPGIKTPRDYMNYVKKKLGIPIMILGTGFVLFLLAGAWILMRRK